MAIKAPVLMVHGTFDPHPGRLILASLEPYLPQLEYRELERCGHWPWLEKSVSEGFFSLIREWLGRTRELDSPPQIVAFEELKLVNCARAGDRAGLFCSPLEIDEDSAGGYSPALRAPHSSGDLHEGACLFPACIFRDAALGLHPFR
jgi:hypothetical protein